MRAHDILTDADQRATYDQLLAIALQRRLPPQATRTYEVVRQGTPPTRWRRRSFRRCWSGAIPCSGSFQNHRRRGNRDRQDRRRNARAFAAALPTSPAQTETRVRREGKDRPTERSRHQRLRRQRKSRLPPGPIGRFEPVPASPRYNLGGPGPPAFRSRLFRSLHRLCMADRCFRASLTDCRAVKRATDSKKNQKRRARAAQAIAPSCPSRTPALVQSRKANLDPPRP